MNCSVAVVFLVATVYVHMTPSTKKDIYRAYLNEEQNARYDKIIKERRDISLQGYGLGLLLAVTIVLARYFRKIMLTDGATVCVAMSVALATHYFYYVLSEKSDWMVLHMETKEQKQAWLDIYRAMQVNYHVGIVTGVLAVAFMAKTLKCK